jgi:hypothetical protein
MGIEPTAQAWEAWVLPLYDARLQGIVVALSWIRQMRRPKKKGAPRGRPSDSRK